MGPRSGSRPVRGSSSASMTSSRRKNGTRSPGLGGAGTESTVSPDGVGYAPGTKDRPSLSPHLGGQHEQRHTAQVRKREADGGSAVSNPARNTLHVRRGEEVSNQEEAESHPDRDQPDRGVSDHGKQIREPGSVPGDVDSLACTTRRSTPDLLSTARSAVPSVLPVTGGGGHSMVRGTSSEVLRSRSETHRMFGSDQLA